MSGQWSEFGTGKAGEDARAMVGKVPCKNCGGVSTHTIDVDVLGGLEQFASCNLCHAIITAILTFDLEQSLHVVPGTFSTNGLGRQVVINDQPALKRSL
jgi:hypothetical protein